MEPFTLFLAATSVLLAFVIIGVALASVFPNLTESVRGMLLGDFSHCESSTSKKQEG